MNTIGEVENNIRQLYLQKRIGMLQESAMKVLGEIEGNSTLEKSGKEKLGRIYNEILLLHKQIEKPIKVVFGSALADKIKDKIKIIKE